MKFVGLILISLLILPGIVGRQIQEQETQLFNSETGCTPVGTNGGSVCYW